MTALSPHSPDTGRRPSSPPPDSDGDRAGSSTTRSRTRSSGPLLEGEAAAVGRRERLDWSIEIDPSRPLIDEDRFGLTQLPFVQRLSKSQQEALRAHIAA